MRVQQFVVSKANERDSIRGVTLTKIMRFFTRVGQRNFAQNFEDSWLTPEEKSVKFMVGYARQIFHSKYKLGLKILQR